MGPCFKLQLFLFHCRASTSHNQPKFGRHDAHKHRDTMGDVSSVQLINYL